MSENAYQAYLEHGSTDDYQNADPDEDFDDDTEPDHESEDGPWPL